MKSKTPRADELLADYLSANTYRRMVARYRGMKGVNSDSAMINVLVKESGVGRSTIQRILDPHKYGEHKTSMDKVAKLARALRCEAYELLIPPPSETIEDDL